MAAAFVFVYFVFSVIIKISFVGSLIFCYQMNCSLLLLYTVRSLYFIFNTLTFYMTAFLFFPKKPKSVQLYNQIGNFWRIKGDAAKAIECFRRALAVSPHNSEVLLNLARVLFTLQYLDDAIFLTRRSLEVQAPDKGAWQHYFTLGEIFKAYGHYQEATAHLKHTLELKPGFEPAEVALKEMETMPAGTIHIYTLVIIVFLVSIHVSLDRKKIRRLH